MNRCLIAIACVGAGALRAHAQWTPQWTPLGIGVSQQVRGIAAGALPHSPRFPHGIYVTGAFSAAGGKPVFRNAMWTGTEWLDLHSGMESPGNSCWLNLVWPHPGTTGVKAELYVAGDLYQIGTEPALNVVGWDGHSWHNLAGGLTSPATNSAVTALAAYDEDANGPGEPVLYAGGGFKLAGGLACNGLARWDGTKWWPPPEQPGRVNPNTSPTIYALTVYDDDGAGPRRPGLYVAGVLDKVGSLSARNIARWDGTTWEALGAGTNGVSSTVNCMCVFDDDGPGPRPAALFVSGDFSQAGGMPALGFARWDGTAWSAPSGPAARSMVVWDEDGPGPLREALYTAGYLLVCRWRGVGSGFDAIGALSGGIAGDSFGYTLCPWDEDGPGPNPGGLYVGGQFKFINGAPFNYIARWGCPLPPGGPCYPDCNQDSQLNLSDFGCFQTRFATGDQYADCNQDGLRNLSDFGCFQTKFALGCP